MTTLFRLTFAMVAEPIAMGIITLTKQALGLYSSGQAGAGGAS